MINKSVVVFFVFQTENRANGGVRSVDLIISNIGSLTPVIITNRESVFTKKWMESGYEVFIFDRSKRLNRVDVSLCRLVNLVTFRRLFKRDSISAVHFNDIQFFRVYGRSLEGFKGRVILNLRGIKKSYGRSWRIVRYADVILSLSREMNDRFQKELPLDTHHGLAFEYLYSIINFKEYFPLNLLQLGNVRNLCQMREGFNHILYVASFSELKNQLGFIRALDRALLSNNRLIFHFLGDFRPKDDIYANECFQYCLEHQLLEFVNFHGYDANMSRWYQAADLTLIASQREGLSRSMIESLACGTPVVSFDVCSSHEILTCYDCGIVVDQGDYDGLLNEIIHIVTDKDRICHYSQNAVKMSRFLFDQSRIITKYEELISII